jgi:hypothetical protein
MSEYNLSFKTSTLTQTHYRNTSEYTGSQA